MRSTMREVGQETEAKLTTIKDQIGNANDKFKTSLEQRSASLRAHADQFTNKVEQSWQRAKDKLG